MAHPFDHGLLLACCVKIFNLESPPFYNMIMILYMPKLIFWYYKKKKSGYYLLHISCVQSAATWRLHSESIPSAIISEYPGHVRHCAGQQGWAGETSSFL